MEEPSFEYKVSLDRGKFGALGRSALGEADSDYCLVCLGAQNFHCAEVVVHSMSFGASHFWCISDNLVYTQIHCVQISIVDNQKIYTTHMISLSFRDLSFH